jgi:hypothetical protein
MSHSLCVMGVYDEVKMTVPMVVHHVHSDKKEKRNIVCRKFRLSVNTSLPWQLRCFL